MMKTPQELARALGDRPWTAGTSTTNGNVKVVIPEGRMIDLDSEPTEGWVVKEVYPEQYGGAVVVLRPGNE